MAMISLLEITVSFLCFSFFFGYFLIMKKPHRSFPTNWPFLGMLPGLLVEIPRVYDYVTEFLEASNLTFPFKGPCFGGLDMLFTVDPANIHHIGVQEALQCLRRWDFQRGFRFMEGSEEISSKHDESPGVSKDVFQRFTFDTTFVLATGIDPGCLSIEMPKIEFAKALDEAEEAIFFRHFKPEIVWKMQRLLGFGDELKMSIAHSTFDRVCSECIASKRDEITRGVTSIHSSSKDLLMSYMDVDTTKYKLLNPGDDKFLRDMILSFMLAGRDTTGSALTWFFWLLSKNPEVTTKIRQEINTKLSPRTNNDSDHFSLFNPQDLNKLVYLHGALCEALRLYPPVPFQHKSPTKPDVLPSGHRVDASTKIVFCLYSLGRMKSLWGEDASEFKPERWISETGRLIHVPSFKFLSFNAGPRTCLGKEVAMTQMKTVAVKVIQNYEIEIVEGHKIEPVPSIILHMKQGLKVMVTKRCNLV
ncbi:hypothetical protein F2Q69_00062776 [Brassica cretica]|uniref:Alkane hydroxylase MAH1-like n=3 Tax=Brassica TaxID=3705 RepID=A0A8S9RK71_BRACR|nr:hypothetical protein F2Q69_00062776 [Brassica cretica]